VLDGRKVGVSLESCNCEVIDNDMVRGAFADTSRG